PTDEDGRTFVSYLCGEMTEHPLFDNQSVTQEIGVLVAGYGAMDERTNGLFKFALKHLKNLHVFWVCHTQKDHDRLNDDRVFKSELGNPDVARRFHIVTADFELFALYFYQEITGTIPPCGMFFPAAWNLPHPVKIPPP